MQDILFSYLSQLVILWLWILNQYSRVLVGNQLLIKRIKQRYALKPACTHIILNCIVFFEVLETRSMPSKLIQLITTRRSIFIIGLGWNLLLRLGSICWSTNFGGIHSRSENINFTCLVQRLIPFVFNCVHWKVFILCGANHFLSCLYLILLHLDLIKMEVVLSRTACNNSMTCGLIMLSHSMSLISRIGMRYKSSILVIINQCIEEMSSSHVVVWIVKQQTEVLCV